jgi:hypothetical protein
MRRILSIVVALSFLLTAYARGTVTISISGSGSTSNASPSSGQAFTLTASGGTVGFTVYADSSTDIGRITLTGSGTVSLLIGSSGSFPSNQTTPFSSFLSRDWGGLALSSFSGSVRVAGAVGRDLTGSVTATQVYRLQIAHDAADVITATGVDVSSTDFAMGPVLVGRSISSTGGVAATATPGMGQALTVLDVRTGTTTSGSSDMAGTISTDHGTILSIVANDDLRVPFPVLCWATVVRRARMR